MSDIKDGSAVFTVRDKRAQALFDFVYPVGIVVALANDKKPAFMEYGTWEKVAEDRVLQGSSDGNAPGKKIEAGLPNITGYVHGGLRITVIKFKLVGLFLKAPPLIFQFRAEKARKV